MQILLSVTDPTPGFEEDLRQLLARHAAHVTFDASWTPDRARRYFETLGPRARNILVEAVSRDGFVPADALRTEQEPNLRGHSGGLKSVYEKGVAKGWWPDGMEIPVRPVGPGFGKVAGYQMPEELVPVFFQAIRDSRTGVQT
ncbi:hypothetical protein ACWDG9_16780 [Streptomyces sp. NPDC001073]